MRNILFTAQYTPSSNNKSDEYKTIKCYESWVTRAKLDIDEGTISSDMEDLIDFPEINKLSESLENPFFILQSVLVMKQMEQISGISDENPKHYIPAWASMLNEHRGWVELLLIWVRG